MMKRVRLWSLVTWVASGASFGLGCGPENSAPEQPEKDVPAGTFAKDFVADFCNGLETCCSSRSMPFNRTSCDEATQGLLRLSQSTSPRQKFDDVAARACLANVRAAAPACAPIELEPCERVYVGTVPTGQACDAFDCAPVPGAIVSCLSGTCRAAHRATLGESCKRTCYAEDQCTQVPGEPAFDVTTANSWGDCYVDDGLACVGGSCVRAPAAGNPCLGGQFCDQGARCASGTCEPYPALGSPCGICAPGQYCDAGICTAKAALGASCFEDQACASGRCETTCSSPTAGEAHGTRDECSGAVHL